LTDKGSGFHVSIIMQAVLVLVAGDKENLLLFLSEIFYFEICI